MANHKPSPWGQGDPSPFKGDPQNLKEMVRLLTPEREDEKKASEKYLELQQQAEMIGRPDIAKKLEKISEDEHHHFVILNNIITQLQRLVEVTEFLS